MSIYHEHNLAHPLPHDCRFGLRVRLRNTDPFKKLIGADWHKEHWFATAAERDHALAKMSERYIYFRDSDTPTLQFEKIHKA
jgi:hypothetical protein